MAFRRAVVIVAILVALMVAPGIFEDGYFVANGTAFLICAVAFLLAVLVPFKGEKKSAGVPMAHKVR